MSDSKAVVSSGWSSLSTIDNFDGGVNKKNFNIIATTEDTSKTTVKSLFVESLVDQFCKLLEKDPSKRHKLYEGICQKLYNMHLIESTYNIEELAPLRGFYQQAFLDVIVTHDSRILSSPCFKFGISRYATEYEEICFIASGGFGKVFKAKNCLDQVIYAVKKIPLKYQSITIFQKKLNEVKTLAKLSHPNIVQYKAAWLEPLFDSFPTRQSPKGNILSCNDSDVVVFQYNQSSSTNSSNQISQEENENNMALCKYPAKGALQRPEPQVSALLYITMQLRDETLNEWLHKRNVNNTVDLPLALYIMVEATTGVEYIHSCNVIHHDIKPRNIFLSSDLKSVEVGDFGLSCLEEHHRSGCPLEGGRFGTPLYAAPEQLKGCCDSKSDIFSLGLVFVELLTVFSTEMERAKILTKARSGDLPSSIPLALVPIISKLLSRKPNDRPTATELIISLKKISQTDLNGTIKESKEICQTVKETDLVLKLNDTSKHSVAEDRDELIKDKDREIFELKRMLAQRDNEIAHLKHLVTQCSS